MPDAAPKPQFQRRRQALRIMLGGAIAEDAEPQFAVAMRALDRLALLEKFRKRQVGDLPGLCRHRRRSTR